MLKTFDHKTWCLQLECPTKVAKQRTTLPWQGSKDGWWHILISSLFQWKMPSEIQQGGNRAYKVRVVRGKCRSEPVDDVMCFWHWIRVWVVGFRCCESAWGNASHMHHSFLGQVQLVLEMLLLCTFKCWHTCPRYQNVKWLPPADSSIHMGISHDK